MGTQIEQFLKIVGATMIFISNDCIIEKQEIGVIRVETLAFSSNHKCWTISMDKAITFYDIRTSLQLIIGHGFPHIPR